MKMTIMVEEQIMEMVVKWAETITIIKMIITASIKIIRMIEFEFSNNKKINIKID